MFNKSFFLKKEVLSYFFILTCLLIMPVFVSCGKEEKVVVDEGEKEEEVPITENEWSLGERPGIKIFRGNYEAAFQYGVSHQVTDFKPKHTFWYAQARMLNFELNDDQASKDEAFDYMSKALSNMDGDDPPFQLWAAIDSYLKWRHLMPDALRKKFRMALVNSPHYDYHDTQNKNMMAATARYLASETWPGADFKSDYSEEDPTGKNTLMEEMKNYVSQGEREHNSSTYFAMHLGTILSLADLAQGPEMNKRAKIAADWMLISAAAEWHHGYWAAAAERVYFPFREQGKYRASTIYLYLYFDGPDPYRWGKDLSVVMQGLTSYYRAPEYIYKISQARDKPYIHKETHLHPLAGTRIFYLQTYMTDDFAVFSQHEDYTSWPRWMNQMIRWGVNLDRPSGEKTCLFIQHPNGGKGPAYVLGETEFGQVLQNETSVVGVYQIPVDSKHPFLKGWIPPDHDAVIDSTESSGKLFLHYGRTAIALQLSEKFSWAPGDENFFIRDKSEVGFALEVFPASSLAGGSAMKQLENLAQEIASRSKMNLDFSGVPSMKYIDTKGKTLETRLHNGDFLNGSKIDYSQWPLLKNPWVEQAFEGNILTVNIDGQKIEYDFDQWEKRVK